MRRRKGFTLVELMVSLALIIFIMAILSQAFVTATQTFRDLKAAGDMAAKLRSVTQLLQRELAADHFEGKKRLSDPNFWLNNPAGALSSPANAINGPPAQGFLRLWQGSRPVPEGPNIADADGLFSYRSVDHMLHFTIKYRGNQRSDFLTASLASAPAGTSLSTTLTGYESNPESRYQDATNTYSYQWAECILFLRPAIDPNTGLQDTANGTPLYSLYHRQRLLVPDNNLVTDAAGNALPAARYSSFLDFSCQQVPPLFPPRQVPTTLYFNNPTDVTIPQRRFGVDPFTGYPSNTNFAAYGLTYTYPTLADETGTADASDLWLTDVISFDVRILLSGGTDFIDLYDPTFRATWQNADTAGNSNPLYLVNPLTPLVGPKVFDTWSSLPNFQPSAGPPPPPPGTPPPYPPSYDNWNNTPTIPPPAVNPMRNYTVIPWWSGNTGPIIKAIQITIRIWDPRAQLTRQVTLVQAM